MNQDNSALRNVVRQLLAIEEDNVDNVEPIGPALCVLAKLRSHLTKRVGSAGFAALLTRAVALARMEADWLEAVQVDADANLTGLGEAARKQSADRAAAGAVSLLAQLIGLLVTFIGETLTMAIMRELWPDARIENLNSCAEETTK
jgi:hypothetical protein